MLVGGIVFHVIKNLNITDVVYRHFKLNLKIFKVEIDSLRQGIFIGKIADFMRNFKEIKKIVKNVVGVVLSVLNSIVFRKNFADV